MKRFYQILIPLLSLFLVRVDLTDLWPLSQKVQVLKIMDGDTLLVGLNQQRIKLRISKIDAPEKGQPFLDGPGDAGKASKECLLQTLKSIREKKLITYGHDMYGRTLGDLSDLSFKLVQNGCVALYPHARFSSKNEKMNYLRAYTLARRMGKGLWSRGGFETPKNWRKKNKKRNPKWISYNRN